MDPNFEVEEPETVAVENVEIEEQSGYGVEEETEREEMEVMIITSEDFSGLIQIQNVEQHWEVTQDMESQHIIHSVGNLEESEENTTGKGSGDLDQEQCSRIIQIAFDSTVQNGDGGDADQTETNYIQMSDNMIVATTDTEEHQARKEVDDNEPGEIEMTEIVDAGTRDSELEESVTGVEYQADNCCCIICGELFGDEEVLKLHRASHAEEEHYACAVCDLKFRDRRSLSLHMLQHTNNDEPHECVECNKRFRHESAWRRHNNKFHVTDFSGPTACSECRKVFKTETALRRHDQIVHEAVPALVEYFEKDQSALSIVPYSCFKCSMSFSNEETLSRHYGAKHSGVLCYYCDKVFMNKMLLKQHSKDVHNPERPYACYKCWKRFTNGPEAKAHLTEAHNINMVRPVGVGRQKDDMYSTNFYDKTKLVQNAFVLQNKPDPSKRRSPKVVSLGLGEPEPSKDDLAARLKGRLSEHPRLIAKRKTKCVSSVDEPKLPDDPRPQLTPCFSPPKQFKQPGIHIRKTKWGAAEPRENEQEQEDDTWTDESVEVSSRAKHTETKEMNSNPKYDDPYSKRVGYSVDGRKGAKGRRRRLRSPTNQGGTSVKSVDVCLKKAKVVLTRLSSSVVQQHQSEHSKPPKLSAAVSPGCNKVNSTISVTNCTSFGKSERPRRNVKSIYQTRPNTSEQIAQRSRVRLSETGVQPEEVSALSASGFPEDKRSSSKRRGNPEKKTSETNSRLPDLATASYLLQMMTKEDTTSAAECAGRLGECGDKLVVKPKQNFRLNTKRIFQPPKLITPAELLELRAKLAIEADLGSEPQQLQSNSTFMQDKLKMFSNNEPEVVDLAS